MDHTGLDGSGNYPYIALDNLIVTVTDDQGNVYTLIHQMTLDTTHTAAMTQRLLTTEQLTSVDLVVCSTGIVTESLRHLTLEIRQTCI